MNLLRSMTGSMTWVGGLAGIAACCVVGCSKTESLGTRDTNPVDQDGGGVRDAGPTGAGGALPQGAGGRSSGGAQPGGAGGKQPQGTGGTHAGGGAGGGGAGGGGEGGDGGKNECLGVFNCPQIPVTCDAGDVLMRTADNCCPHCVPQSNETHAACIIGGVRYEHLAVVKKTGCASCLCVNGHIGDCTGACLPDEPDSGPDQPLPTCPEGQKLIEACSDCGPTDACTAFEFKCRNVSDPPCVSSGDGPRCGAEQACIQGACVDALQCG